jgi:hypothetical protein
MQMSWITDNLVFNNSAGSGGGIRFCYFYVVPHNPDIFNNIFYDNHAREYGGGVHSYAAHPTLRNCTFNGNWADGVGGGAYVESSSTGPLTLVDCIFASSPAGGGLAVAPDGDLVNSYCDVWGNVPRDYIDCVPGPGDISGDPLYCGLPSPESPWDLYDASPCVGIGSGGWDIGARGVGCFIEPNVVFYDNFSDQFDDGWFAEASGGGAISVVAGQYCFLSDVEGWLRSTVRELDVGNLTYTLNLIPQEGFGLMRILFRYGGPVTYYQISLDGMEGRLEKETPDAPGQLLVGFPCTLLDGTRYDFKIQADAGLLRGCYRWQDTDWMPLFTVVDPDYLPSGTIGLGAALGKHVHYDNILVLDNGASGIPEDDGVRPAAAAVLLGLNMPNPFDRLTTLPISVREGGRISLAVFDVGGRLVRPLVDKDLPAGEYAFQWDGKDARGHPLGGGIYFCRLGGRGDQMQRLVLLK